MGKDAEAVRLGREKTWSAIRAKVKAEGAACSSPTPVGIRTDQVTGRTWGEKGRTPIGRRIDNRFSANATSAINTKGRIRPWCSGQSQTEGRCGTADPDADRVELASVE